MYLDPQDYFDKFIEQIAGSANDSAPARQLARKAFASGWNARDRECGLGNRMKWVDEG